MTRRAAAAALAALLVVDLGSCSGRGDASPEIPWPDLSRAQPRVRAQLESAVAAWRAAAGGDRARRAEAAGRLGMHFQAYRLWDAAAACYTLALDSAPAEPRWNYLLARVRQQLGDPDGAVALAQRTLESGPAELLPVYLLLAESEAERGNPDAARAALDRALQIEPRSAAALLVRGRLALAAGEFAPAVRDLQAALEQAPQATAIHYPLGLAYRGLGQGERAAALFERRGEVPPRVLDRYMEQIEQLNLGLLAHQSRGDALLQLGRLDEALEQYRQAASVTPDDPRLHINVGHVLERLDRLDEAREAFELAPALAPDYAPAHYNLATVLTRVGDDASAVQHYERALRLDAGLVRAQYNRANALRRLGRFDEAAQAYGAVVDADPGHASARVYEGLALVRLRRHAEARRRIERALELFPDDLRLLQILVRLLAAAPEAVVRDGARAEKLAVGLDRDDAAVDQLAALAMVRAERGDFAAAERIQLRAIEELGHGPDYVRRELERNLALYRAGRPCRRPWSDEDPAISPGPVSAVDVNRPRRPSK